MPDLTYAAVKASGRKGKLLTEQQLMELASQKDLKDLINKIRPNYQSLTNASPELVEFESILKDGFLKEADEFIKNTPEASDLLMLIKKQMQEGDVVELMKWHLGAIGEAQVNTPLKKYGKQDALKALKAMGYGEEADAAESIYKRHSVPALIDSVFVRGGLMRLAATLEKMKGNGEPLIGYLKLKIDIYNVFTIIRGLKNGIDPKAIEDVLLFNGGTLGRAELLEALKAGDQAKAFAYLEGKGVPKAETPRELEREYDRRIVSNLQSAYRDGYVEAGAVISYLELKSNEVKNLIRIANAIERGVDQKSLMQSYLS